MHLRATYSKLSLLGILSIFLWLPLASNVQASPSDQTEGEVLSTKGSAHVLNDVINGSGGILSAALKSSNGLPTFTGDQLKWFNRHSLISYAMAKSIFLSNKELIQHRVFMIAISFLQEPVNIQ